MARITGSMTVDELFLELARLGVHSFHVTTTSAPFAARFTCSIGHLSGDGFSMGFSGDTPTRAIVIAVDDVEQQLARDVGAVAPADLKVVP